MSKFKFQNQVDTIIAWYNQGKSYAEIARLLKSDDIINDSQNVRRLLRNKLGNIHGHPKIVLTKYVKQQLQKLWKEGKTPTQMSKILGINAVTISSYFRGKGIKFNPNPGNIDYFEKIDTYSKAYILGFIVADGALVPAKHGSTITLTITIKYEDKALLEFIKSEIGCDYKLLEIRRPSSYDKSKIIHHIRLSMSTPKLVHDIMKYGITPRKSLTISNIITNIPYLFRDAFIIGYFDGDGSVSAPKYSHSNKYGCKYEDHTLRIQIRGTKAFLEGICEHLNIDKKHIYKCDSIPQLSFANKKDVYRFYKCYEHLSFYYKRKHDKFIQRINHPSFDKYKQVQTISSSVA